VLHAQSGAGKTSLLNASVIPGLEARGWFPVRVLLHDNPVRATQIATLQYLLPPPEAEIFAIRRACLALGIDETRAAIDELLKRYDALKERDPRKRELIAPIESEEWRAAYPQTGSGSVTPYTCRVLRASLDLKAASEQWSLVREMAEPGAQSGALTEDLPIAELIASLDTTKFKAAYRTLVACLDPPGRCGLDDFFANLVSVYGARFSRFGLVLLFDQFEEIFTRFVDPGPFDKASIGLAEPIADQPKPHQGMRPYGELPDWRLRYEFFEELAQLYTMSLGSGPLPVRVVLSMRSEYVAQLDAVRSFVPAVDQCTEHLQLLDVDATSAAIKKPADEFGYGYTKDCYDKIVNDLTKEDRFVEPAHLQIVCEHLWNVKGRALVEKSEPAKPTERLVPLTVYETEKGVAGIMRAFLWGYLNGLNQEERAETVEILEQLITPSRTRNIVAREFLVRCPFRRAERRERLLDQLVDRTIVRAEKRHGGYFIEITHEFLIEPIREAIYQIAYANPDHRRFLLALDGLGRVREISSTNGTEATLMDWEFEALHKYRVEVEWEPWAVEAMFRNSVCHEAEPTVIRTWAAMLNDYPPREPRTADA
jgi:hypothetical protein